MTQANITLDEFAEHCRAVASDAASPDAWRDEAGDCLRAIAKSPPLFVSALSNWLVNENDVALAQAIVTEANVRYLCQQNANDYDLSKVEVDAAIFCAYRLCALPGTATAISLGWTLSLVASFPNSDVAKKAVIHLLSFHIDEFPSTTIKMLSSSEVIFKESEVVNAALIALRKDDTCLNEQPKLREFAMTPEMRLSLSSLRKRESRTIQRVAQENSMFAKICTIQHFKYANKTAVEFAIDDKIQESVLEMSSHNFSLELPISEGTDPIAGNSRRNALWEGPVA